MPKNIDVVNETSNGVQGDERNSPRRRRTFRGLQQHIKVRSDRRDLAQKGSKASTTPIEPRKLKEAILQRQRPRQAKPTRLRNNRLQPRMSGTL